MLHSISNYAQSYVNGNSLYSVTSVHKIELFSGLPSLVDSLADGEYRAVDILINGIALDSVGVKARGASSFFSCYPKIPLKINLNKYITGQNYDGINDFNLLNQIGDPTYLHNYLFAYLSKKTATIAPRASFAKVYLNGDYLGVYTIVEDLDKRFLDNHFPNNDGNLYKSNGNSFHNADSASAVLEFEQMLKEFGDTSFNDLIDLSLSCYASDSSNVYTAVSPKFNFDNFLKSMVNLWFTQSWDSYYQGKNYYLYHNTTDSKFYFISWDNNLICDLPTMNFDIKYNGVDQFFNKVVANPVVGSKYFQYLCEFNDAAYDTIALFNHIDSVVALISPDVLSEIYDCEYSKADFLTSIENTFYDSLNSKVFIGLKPFLRMMKAEVSGQLSLVGYTCSPLGVEKIDEPNVFSVYPNPSYGIVNIDIKVQESYDITIMDLTGKILLSTSNNVNSTSVKLTQFGTGVYVLHLKQKQGKTNVFKWVNY